MFDIILELGWNSLPAPNLTEASCYSPEIPFFGGMRSRNVANSWVFCSWEFPVLSCLAPPSLKTSWSWELNSLSLHTHTHTHTHPHTQAALSENQFLIRWKQVELAALSCITCIIWKYRAAAQNWNSAVSLWWRNFFFYRHTDGSQEAHGYFLYNCSLVTVSHCWLYAGFCTIFIVPLLRL